MREKLKELRGERLTFTARVSQCVDSYTRRGKPLDLAVLEDVYYGDELVAEHVWVRRGSFWWDWLGENEIIEFDATVGEYEKSAPKKGKRNRKMIDYNLQHIIPRAVM